MMLGKARLPQCGRITVKPAKQSGLVNGCEFTSSILTVYLKQKTE